MECNRFHHFAKDPMPCIHAAFSNAELQHDLVSERESYAHLLINESSPISLSRSLAGVVVGASRKVQGVWIDVSYCAFSNRFGDLAREAFGKNRLV